MPFSRHSSTQLKWFEAAGMMRLASAILEIQRHDYPSRGEKNHVSFPHPFYRWRPHPWHGLEIGPDPPRVVHAFIEITPFDLIKYEVDKTTGYIRVDRPQRTSSLPPSLYGFIPRTFCAERVKGAIADGEERRRGSARHLRFERTPDKPVRGHPQCTGDRGHPYD